MSQDLSLRASLEAIVGPERVLDRPVERVAFAADAGFYRLIPRAVVFAQSVAEVQALFRFSRQSGLPMTFRASGTSLSGQAISDGILVEVARHWRSIQVLEGGARIKVQPGVIGAHVNLALRPYRSKMGPDPASIATCTVGGILSNNSSGMCCGVVQNAYHTLDSLTFVLPSGTVIDTAAPDADDQFRTQEPALARGPPGPEGRDRGQPGPDRADPDQVPDEEHHGLFAQRLHRLCPPGGHLPQPAGRLRRHPRLHRRGGVAHRAGSAGQGHRLPAVP